MKKKRCFEKFGFGCMVALTLLWAAACKNSDTSAPTPTPSPVAKSARNVWTDAVTKMEFVWIEGGCFEMGQTEADKAQLIAERGEGIYVGFFMDEIPRHQVCVDGFLMGKYEVTNAQYRAWQPNHDSQSLEGHSLNGDDQPAVFVNWQEAEDFAAWLTTRSGEGKWVFRLPSEAEWEYAARAGTTTIRYWGDDPDHSQACQYGNMADLTMRKQWPDWKIHHCDDGYIAPAPVGRFQPNAFGLYDMLGNVWEWTRDTYIANIYEEKFSDAPLHNPLTMRGATERVIRGGSCYKDPVHVRAAARNGFPLEERHNDFGFRLVRTAASQ